MEDDDDWVPGGCPCGCGVDAPDSLKLFLARAQYELNGSDYAPAWAWLPTIEFVITNLTLFAVV